MYSCTINNLKNFKLNPNWLRVGILPYWIINNNIYLLLGIYKVSDSKFEICALSGGYKRTIESIENGAFREFNEETNLMSHQYDLIHMNTITEKFIGTNGVRYQHTYYLSQINCDVNPKIDDNNIDQVSEIGDMGWYSYQECRKMIRNYNIDKKIKLDNIYYFLKLLLSQSIYDDDFFLEK